MRARCFTVRVLSGPTSSKFRFSVSPGSDKGLSKKLVFECTAADERKDWISAIMSVCDSVGAKAQGKRYLETLLFHSHAVDVVSTVHLRFVEQAARRISADFEAGDQRGDEDEEVGEEIMDVIMQRCRGNPLFTKEMVRSLQ